MIQNREDRGNTDKNTQSHSDETQENEKEETKKDHFQSRNVGTVANVNVQLKNYNTIHTNEDTISNDSSRIIE